MSPPIPRSPRRVVGRRQGVFSARRGEPCAIVPEAFGVFYDLPECQLEPTIIADGRIAVVAIEGPLEQRANWWCDGYDAIRGRFEAALESEAQAILLCLDSPGGVVAGCFETVRAMRAAARSSGKRVVAFANEHAYSAAYALATVATEIYLPVPGGVGSIGVIATLIDITQSLESEGIHVEVLTSGDEKADGNPLVPLDDPARKRQQARVDQLAEQFAELVAEQRGGTAEDWLLLQAGTRYGADAVADGLVDGVLSLDELVAVMSNMGSSAPSTSDQEDEMAAKKSSTSTKLATKGAAALAAKPTAAKYKKTRKVEETEQSEDEESEDAEDDDEAEAPTDDDDDDDGDEDATAADAEDDDSDEDAEDDDSKGKRMSVAASVYEAARTLTGKRGASEIIGALQANAHASQHAQDMTRRLAALEQRDKKARVDKIVNGAMRSGKLTPKQGEWARAYGMKDIKGLKAYLANAVPMVFTDEDSPREASATGGAPRSIQGDKRAADAMGAWKMYQDPAVRERLEKEDAGGNFPRN